MSFKRNIESVVIVTICHMMKILSGCLLRWRNLMGVLILTSGEMKLMIINLVYIRILRCGQS